MPSTNLIVPEIETPSETHTLAACYHCGADCGDAAVDLGDKHFCCTGCRTVYQILNENDLCAYYDLNAQPGKQAQGFFRKDKFAFLDNVQIADSLLYFQDEKQARVRLYLPHVHCSSCLWLLENVSKIEPGILSSQVNFPKKEVNIVFDRQQTTLRKVAETLSMIGYEPYISLQNMDKQAATQGDRSRIYKIGVAGFCFGNIMMMSFPEYFAGGGYIEADLQLLFRYLNLGLSLPALLYSGAEFFESSYKGIRQKFLNIDIPIALALLVTFGRSLYEVLSGTGSGYFDSMAGIIFFMLVGRWLQDKTYSAISFDRDYKSYFPLAVTRLKDGKEESVALPDIQEGDILLIHHDELIPADGILSKGEAEIDNSFITGESLPVEKQIGELIYAGGRQMGQNIELLVTREVTQSYLTDLWNQHRYQKKEESHSFIHRYSQIFTVVLLSLAALTAIYWGVVDSSRLLPAVTAMLIVACPCALLLSATFTFGNLLSIMAGKQFYLRNSDTVEELAKADYWVFDKTGTLTHSQAHTITYEGKTLKADDLKALSMLARQSQHPLSVVLYHYLVNHGGKQIGQTFPAAVTLGEGSAGFLSDFQNLTGQGISATLNGKPYKLGSAAFTHAPADKAKRLGSQVHVAIEGEYVGCYYIHNSYREGIDKLLRQLAKTQRVAVISGDNESEKAHLQSLIGTDCQLLFNQKPQDKLQFVSDLQAQGKKVVMVGDGLNDAGALRQSNVGIAVTEHANYFTPACDAILHASMLPKLHQFVKLSKAGKNIIHASFALSICYNLIGLSIAMQGNMSPFIAAILMPISSISIVLLTFGMSKLLGYRYVGK